MTIKLPRQTRRKINKIVASMSVEERSAWDAMVAEDETMLFECLMIEHAEGGVFDLDGIQAHFRVSRLLMEAMGNSTARPR